MTDSTDEVEGLYDEEMELYNDYEIEQIRYLESRNLPLDTPLWVTKNGDIMLVSEMTDSHLKNAFRMFSQIPSPPQFNGEMAQLYADYAFEEEMDIYNQRYNLLKPEMQKRGFIK